MTEHHSTAPVPSSKPAKPDKPYPEFPLFPHATRRWAKKIKGRMHYFGRWDDPDGALREYHDFLAGKARPARAADPNKPAKPSPDFPLFAHASGQWAKKIRGQLHYFGVWDDPDAALDKYLAEKDALHAGKKPRANPDAFTVKEAVNVFLNHKRAMADAGELTERTFREYEAMAVLMAAHFGKSRLVTDLDPSDFASLRNKLAKKWGPHRLKKAIQYIRCIYKHAFDAGLIDRPVRFG